MQYLNFYLLVINALGFALMLADKQKAIHRRWRIPEWMLMTVAALGGSIGSLLAMNAFRHKTRHPVFTLGVPLLAVIHLVIYTLLQA